MMGGMAVEVAAKHFKEYTHSPTVIVNPKKKHKTIQQLK
jgi:hypothetical protein